MSGLPRAVLDKAVGETRTRDLSITSPTIGYRTTHTNIKIEHHMNGIRKSFICRDFNVTRWHFCPCTHFEKKTEDAMVS